jgi:nucleoside-diphosphate-sugar epimerase
MSKVLVTGGAGFIASYVIEQLLRQGCEVVTTVRHDGWKVDPFYGPLLSQCEVYAVDARDAAGMYHIIEKVDGVIHLAAILGTRHVNNAWNFYDNNLRGTINVLEACRDFGVPMTFISVGNYFEHNNYSNSKVAAEREVLKYAKYCGVKANVVRALNAIGGRQKVKNTGKIMSTYVTNALKGLPLQVYGGKNDCSVMDMVFAGDVANVLVNVLYMTMEGKANAQIFEAGTGKGYRVFEIAERVIALTNSTSTIEEIPMRPGETPQSVVVAKSPFPMQYRELDDVIMETVGWFSK